MRNLEAAARRALAVGSITAILGFAGCATPTYVATSGEAFTGHAHEDDADEAARASARHDLGCPNPWVVARGFPLAGKNDWVLDGCGERVTYRATPSETDGSVYRWRMITRTPVP